MKNLYILLLLCSTTLFAQEYQKKWNEVVALEEKGKTRSAKQHVDKIYKQAKKDKNEVQIIKSFFYNSKYLKTLEVDAQIKILDNLQKELKNVSLPSKAILYQVYARCLEAYRNKQYPAISNRTQLDSAVSSDFQTWTHINFQDEINAAYGNSIANEKLLNATPLKNFEPIFDFTWEENFNKQSLFDYLIGEFIHYRGRLGNFYNNGDADFAQDKKALLGPAKEFEKVSFDSVKNADLKLVLSLFQKRERYINSEANEFARLKFMYRHIFRSATEYLTLLEESVNKTKDSIVRQEVRLELAAQYQRLASKDKNPDYNRRALKSLQAINPLFKASYTKAQPLIQNILRKEITIQMQKDLYPDQSSRALVNYKNTNSFTVSYYPINYSLRKLFNLPGLNKDSLRNHIIKTIKPVGTASVKLSERNDFFSYTTEILLPKLSKGIYLAYFEGIGSDPEVKAASIEFIQVSNLTLLAKNKGDLNQYQILNRKTGEPVADAIFKTDTCIGNSDANGRVNCQYLGSIKNPDGELLVVKGIDTLSVVKEFMWRNSYDAGDSNPGKVEFYLDRAIYRPGQKVYYKGIAVQRKGSESQVMTGFPVGIAVTNVNGEKIFSADVITGEFGSFHGEFQLPSGGLTGEFTIKAEEPTKEVLGTWKTFWEESDILYSALDFRVEEYKRPKFEVTFVPTKKQFRVNEPIEAHGVANAFAGSPISNAKVTYKIERATYYNYWQRYEDGAEIIKSGEAQTDEKGKFLIEFLASEDKEPPTDRLPIIKYIISADVTDINGETHSAKTEIKVGYHSLALNVTIDRIVEATESNSVALGSTNLNGEFIPIRGKLEIFKMNTSRKKLQERLWPKPEIAGISAQDFDSLFPYEDNSKPVSQESSGTLVMTQNVDTGKNTTLPINFLKYKPGTYKIVFSSLDQTRTIESSAFFNLNNEQEPSDSTKIVTIRVMNKNPINDGYMLLQLTSVLPRLYLNAAAINNNKQFYESAVELVNNEAVMRIPIGLRMRNTVKVFFEGIFENQYFFAEKDIQLKAPVPKLSFEVETFRSKIAPGATENWSFRLKAENTARESEILASMYDSSLDRFATNNWPATAYSDDDHNYFVRSKMTADPFIRASINNLNPYYPFLRFEDETTQLMWFGFDFVSVNNETANKKYVTQRAKKQKAPADAKMVSGTVSDAVGPIPGANVVVQGSVRSTQTDMDGYYEIEAGKNEVLVFSFVGMTDFSAKVGKSRVINATLEEGVLLSEVVVTGALGIRRVREPVASSQQVMRADELTQASDPNAVLALVARVSGLQINTTNGATGSTTRVVLRGNRNPSGNNQMLVVIDGKISTLEVLQSLPPQSILSVSAIKGPEGAALYGSDGVNGVLIVVTGKSLEQINMVKSRSNMSETAFFYPNLTADATGRVKFSFTAPEALTQWKLRMLGHNKSAASIYFETSTVTQKDVMVVPNLPRFLRETDTITISSKIVNMTKTAKVGIAILQLSDATSMISADFVSNNKDNVKNFSIPAFGNTTVQWKVVIPKGIQGMHFKVVAKAGDFSDGEENILPILTNDIFVTESIPLWVPGKSEKTFNLSNLKNNTSGTLRHHGLTLEYTSNPTWLAIKSLPYLMEYEHDCSEQTFARFYANCLATKIINSNQKLSQLLESWRQDSTADAPLEINSELKSIVLAETPWLNDAKSDAQQKKELAILFDLQQMKRSQNTILEKLKQKQLASGGFSWFDGGRENQYITKHILAGLGHLKKLDAVPESTDDFGSLIAAGISYLDKEFITNKAMSQSIYADIHYLYSRSFFLDEIPLSPKLESIIKLHVSEIKRSWLNYSLYDKAVAALVLYRYGEKSSAGTIIESLKETAANNTDIGMYWVENTAGRSWYQAPIETQALLIEAFTEIAKDKLSADAMKVWLLKGRQGQNWPTTKSTTEAIYAIMLQGTNWLSVKENPTIRMADKKIADPQAKSNNAEAETGYLKMKWDSKQISSEMATVSIENKSSAPGMGGFYWQYFEDVDNVKSSTGTPISISKELYIRSNDQKSDVLKRITKQSPLKVGDLITVRIIITAAETLDYIHLKDMRASCFEPTTVLSEYKWQDGLGYYMSTKDAATHFFFDTIEKGTYILEYNVRVNNVGEFSNGISTIQSMYAPEFSSHTKGIRVSIK